MSDWRDEPCAKCGAQNPENTSPDRNLCDDCNDYVTERFGNV